MGLSFRRAFETFGRDAAQMQSGKDRRADAIGRSLFFGASAAKIAERQATRVTRLALALIQFI
jgi:hypothetical protein